MLRTVDAWGIVERAATQAFPSTQRPLPYRRIANLIGPQISEYLGSLAERLYQLRNQVVHGAAAPTPPEARDYVNAAWRLAAALTEYQDSWLGKPTG